MAGRSPGVRSSVWFSSFYGSRNNSSSRARRLLWLSHVLVQQGRPSRPIRGQTPRSPDRQHGQKPVQIVVDPDVLADFTALPFGDATFTLVVFDPPHTFCGPNGRTIKKYGTLPEGWRDMLKHGFAECFRVLCPGGTLVFKWNEHRVKLSTVLGLTPEQPLFGQKVGNTRTHWLVFHKENT